MCALQYYLLHIMLAEDATRLQKIDELYALRLDQYVSLPQVRYHALLYELN